VLPGVPSVSPIKKELFSKDPVEFVRNIDPKIQHGVKNQSGGLDMPAFGDTHELTQAQIADIEAYVLHLSGVERTKIMNPGVEPRRFFYVLFKILAIMLILVMGWDWVRARKP
jgi:hypothetical protein